MKIKSYLKNTNDVNGIMDKIKETSLLKLDKNHIRTSVFTILDILQLKKLVIAKIFTV